MNEQTGKRGSGKRRNKRHGSNKAKGSESSQHERKTSADSNELCAAPEETSKAESGDSVVIAPVVPNDVHNEKLPSPHHNQVNRAVTTTCTSTGNAFLDAIEKGAKARTKSLNETSGETVAKTVKCPKILNATKVDNGSLPVNSPSRKKSLDEKSSKTIGESSTKGKSRGVVPIQDECVQTPSLLTAAEAERKVYGWQVCGNAGEVRVTEPDDNAQTRKRLSSSKIDSDDSNMQLQSNTSIVPEKSSTDRPAKGSGKSSTKTVKEGASQNETADSASGKSKAELRAERRALQEAQRAAKAAKSVSGKDSSTTPSAPKPKSIPQNNKKVVEAKTPIVKSSAPAPKKKPAASNLVTLFSHLPQCKKEISVIKAAKDGIHSSVIRLGLQYSEGTICGSNARCVSLIYALRQVVLDFKTPEYKDFSTTLYSMHIEPCMNFLEKCRPLSVGMRNVTKRLREEIFSLCKDLQEDEAKRQLDSVLKCFLEDDIMKAHQAIVDLAKSKISSDDVILTYGCSYLVKRILTAAHENAKFRVIVVDARPKLEGRNMLSYLTRKGIKCTYVLINAVATVMKEATKVMMGAHALLANGYVMSRVGSSQVALVAKAFNKPVLVCCETYKFCETVQTDSVVYNELGDPDDLVVVNRPVSPLNGWKDIPSLNILSLYYDVTPPDLITVIINDICLVPCTSVPVLLRVRP